MSNKNILIVDDSATARLILIKCVGMSGIEDIATHEAKNGAEALEILEDMYFDLIITDLNMPVMDGMKLISKISDNSNFNQIPIVVISSSVSQEIIDNKNFKNEVLAIKKPLNPSKLISIIKDIYNG